MGSLLLELRQYVVNDVHHQSFTIALYSWGQERGGEDKGMKEV